jgi:L-ribulose-5-phosphate 3-epimerase
LRIGMLGRFFPGNWRPPADEIRFAADNGFAAIQIRSDEPGAIEDVLRADAHETGSVFADAGVEPVVEMLLRLNDYPSIADALRANLDTLAALGSTRLHVHPVPGSSRIDVDDLHARLPELFAEAVLIARDAGLTLGVEHNSVEHRLLIDPDIVAALLEAVPELYFVWDLNHADPRTFERFRDRLSLVHASDTPLPVTNHHLPIGRGNVDFAVLDGVDVPIILEIGGLPASGGPGFDTDDELLASRDAVRASAQAPAPRTHP